MGRKVSQTGCHGGVVPRQAVKVVGRNRSGLSAARIGSSLGRDAEEQEPSERGSSTVLAHTEMQVTGTPDFSSGLYTRNAVSQTQNFVQLARSELGF